MRKVVLLGLYLLAAPTLAAAWEKTHTHYSHLASGVRGDYYVTAPMVEERTGPASGHIVDRLHFGERVYVHEIFGGWARLTGKGEQGRWVPLDQLSRRKPEMDQNTSAGSKTKTSGNLGDIRWDSGERPHGAVPGKPSKVRSQTDQR